MDDHWLLQISVLIAAGAVSAGIALAVIVRLPADYLSTPRPLAVRQLRIGWVEFVVVLLRNMLGLALVALGTLLSLPGVPGQGLLTIFAGLLLLDVPGKRRLITRLFSQARVLQAINGVRAKWSRPPLMIP